MSLIALDYYFGQCLPVYLYFIHITLKSYVWVSFIGSHKGKQSPIDLRVLGSEWPDGNLMFGFYPIWLVLYNFILQTLTPGTSKAVSLNTHTNILEAICFWNEGFDIMRFSSKYFAAWTHSSPLDDKLGSLLSPFSWCLGLSQSPSCRAFVPHSR